MAKKTNPPEKRVISERVVESYLDLEGDVDTAIDALVKAKAQFGERYDRLFLENEQTCSCPYNDCGCKASLNLYGSRTETDAEFAVRVAAEAERAAAQEARDRAQFEALSKRFSTPATAPLGKRATVKDALAREELAAVAKRLGK